jgi:hypothetical protein
LEYFRDMTLADALAVTTRMRQADRDCLHAVGFTTNPEELALYHWRSEGAAWSMVHEGEPVAICGIRLVTPWCGVAWIVCTDRVSPALWKKLIRHGRIVLANASKRLRRVESYVLSTWVEAQGLASREGFDVEGVRHGAGRDGEDILTMVYRGHHGHSTSRHRIDGRKHG